jgi:uncharacterized protein with ATP-grasp and redox domains
MINNSQRRAFGEVLQAAGEMLEIMDEAGDSIYDKEWREAVRDSIERVAFIVRAHHVYISSKEG